MNISWDKFNSDGHINLQLNYSLNYKMPILQEINIKETDKMFHF